MNNWASYDNDTADLGMSVTFSDQTFDDVTGVGVLADLGRSGSGTAAPTFRLNDFEVALVPEPGTIGLIAAAGTSILFIRRRFRR